MDTNILIETLATYGDQQRIDIINKANEIARKRQYERRRQRRIELEQNLRDLIETIQTEGFCLSIDNDTNHDYILDLKPDQKYSAELYERT